MTGDVLSYGDERPPRPPRDRPRARSLLAGAGAVALLAAGVAGALRSPGATEAGPSPSPSASRSAGWTEYPDAPDPFEVYVSAHRPAPDEAFPLLMPGGVPALLLDEDGSPTAYVAIGGPVHDRVVLGWCRKTGALQDVEGRYVYFRGAPTRPGLRPLRAYPVRGSAGGRGHVDVAVSPSPEQAPTSSTLAELCAEGDDLVLPSLPGVSENLHRQDSSYARMRGRYVVTMESRAFCPANADPNCDAAGWEEYGPHTVLPPGDLASTYIWEGELLVRTEPRDGSLEIVLTNGSRLVRRERVGVAVRVGWAESWQVVGGALRLSFNPFRGEDAPDDSPPGAPRPYPIYGVEDERGGLRQYVLRPDAEVYLGVGVTGLGKPRGTPETLREYLERTEPYAAPPLWLVLDAQGRVIRVVLAPRE